MWFFPSQNLHFGRPVVILTYLVVVSLFGVILRWGCYLSDHLDIFYPSEQSKVFDYIIVGGGSAGGLIASKLARNGLERVLVLEAGKETINLFQIPSVGLLLQQTPFDWAYQTIPQQSACLGLNNNISLWPMGKLLGGTSMLNNMLYVRGHKEDFDEWFRAKDNYDYEDILRIFKDLEISTSGNNQDGGMIHVSDLLFLTELPETLFKAIKRSEYSFRENGNLNCKLGFSIPKANLYAGKRWTSADHLRKMSKSNLIIRTNCFVEKVLFRSNFEAYGVKYNRFGEYYSAYAKKAVILSAGVIGTPKILMLSGIGHRNHLKSLGIDSIVDLPVGDNLQDHLTTGLDLILLNRSLGIGIDSMLSPSSVMDYFLKGLGPWTTTGCEAIAFFDTENQNQRPNLQFMLMPLGVKEDEGYYLRTLTGISDRVWKDYFSKIQSKTMTILPVLLHPKSRGTVRLATNNPLAPPLINPRYLTHRDDIEVLIKGIRLIESLMESEEFKMFGAQFNTLIFPGCSTYVFDSGAYWECYIRHLTMTSYHPVGTCKMGKYEDPSTVVDFNFQVKGTNKLYVVDGSVIPSLPSGNVNGPILMLAHMAADLVQNAYSSSTKQCALIDFFIPETVC